MLTIKHTKKRSSFLITGLAVCMGCSGLYVLALAASPTIAPLILTKTINAQSLPKAKVGENRIIIPKIGVNIHYDTGKVALDRGAEWRYPDRGNPVDGGNFIVAAHRFSIQPTPLGTIEKSPFYNIDKINTGDKVLIDYDGSRYAYEITKKFDVKPTQTEIEAPTTDSRITIYSCELSGAESGRIVFVGKLLGQVEE